MELVKAQLQPPSENRTEIVEADRIVRRMDKARNYRASMQSLGKEILDEEGRVLPNIIASKAFLNDRVQVALRPHSSSGHGEMERELIGGEDSRF